jgi:hypothetical protein
MVHHSVIISIDGPSYTGGGTEEEFRRLRRKHAAVESGLNALENHGLDGCSDHGIDGFTRYVALAVVARNIQLLGRKLQDKLLEEEEERMRVAA